MNLPAKKGIISFFLFFLYGMGLLGILKPADVFSETENRFLQKKPELSKKALLSGSFAKEYEVFISDQFPGRDSWIRVKTIWERLLFKQEINGVYFAHNGSLIKSHPENTMDQAQMEKNVKRLLEFIKAAREMESVVQAQVMLVPTANAILYDELPPFAPEFDQLAFLENLKGIFKKNNMSESIVDISMTLLEHKEEYIFYKTDHHWTTKGAWHTFRKWAEVNKQEMPALEDFYIFPISRDFYGTLTSKVNIKTDPDTISIYQKKTQEDISVYYDFEKEEENQCYHWEKLKGKDKYAVFFGGNHGSVRIEPLAEKNKTKRYGGKRLLLIKDSYANCFTTFLIPYFDQIEMIDLRYFNMPVSEYIKEKEFTHILVLYNIPNFLQEKTVINLK